MKNYFLLIFVLVGGWAIAQKPTAITLNGTLTMQTGEQSPYKTVATDPLDILKGFAYTYSEPNETKVTIKGRIDKQKRKITFKETEIISTHEVHTDAFMCLVHASLEYKQNKLTGPANGEEADNTACTPGTLTFTNSEEVNNLFSSHDKYDEVVTMGGPKVKDPVSAVTEAPAATETTLKQEKITSGVDKTYEWHTDSVVVEIWDGGDYDGDRVTISMDGKPYLSKYYILKQKKRIVIPLKDFDAHQLTIYADEEGTQPPNTASLMLTDGVTHYSLLAYNPKGATSLVGIKRVKK